MSQRCDELSLKSRLFQHLWYDALFHCIVIVAVSYLPLCMSLIHGKQWKQFWIKLHYRNNHPSVL